jgi:hypothetical protein
MINKEQINKALEFVKSKHNGELLYKIDPGQYAKLMIWYQEQPNEKDELIRELLSVLEYLDKHHDGKGICLGYESDRMIEKAIFRVKRFLNETDQRRKA